MGISGRKIWNVVSLTCTIIVAIGAIFGIYAFLVRPTAKLSAVIEYSDVYWPPTIVNLAYKLDDLTELDNIRKALNDPNVNHEDTKKAKVFRNYLIDGLKEFPSNLLTHSGLYRIRINNKGKRICTGVSVKLPHPCLVLVLREDNTREVLENNSVIAIGDLKPQESVSLDSWSNYSSETRMDEIRVTHDSGVASVDIRKTIGYFGRWVDKHINGFTLFVGVLILGVSLYLIDLWREQKDEAKPKNDKS